MPAATTHIEFARDLYNRLPAGFQTAITDMPMFFLGSQGPDMLFYSRASVLPGTLRPYGSRLHREYVRESICYLHDYVQKTPELLSYYDGYLCHYALDSTCHPIINAYARKGASELHRGETEIHFTIESELDVYLLRQKGRSPETFNVHECVAVDSHDRQLIGTYYHDMFADVLHKDISAGRFAGCAASMATLSRALKPDSAMKYQSVFTLEKTFHAQHLVSALMLTGKGGRDPEVLNEQHQPYPNPCVEGGIDRHSFMELYEQALELARQLITDFDPALIRNTFSGTPIPDSTDTPAQ